MPVSYTGGRSVAHPHAFVQLFFDAAHGTTNHHKMAGMAHHAPPIRREVLLVDVPDDTSIITVPGGAMERVGLIGSVILTAFSLLLAGFPRVGTMAKRLLGIDVLPDTPPPRVVAVQ